MAIKGRCLIRRCALSRDEGEVHSSPVREASILSPTPPTSASEGPIMDNPAAPVYFFVESFSQHSATSRAASLHSPRLRFKVI